MGERRQQEWPGVGWDQACDDAIGTKVVRPSGDKDSALYNLVVRVSNDSYGLVLEIAGCTGSPNQSSDGSRRGSRRW